jgi:hypothetical protein
MANDVLSPKFLMEVVRQAAIPRNYLAQNYLPFTDVGSDDLTWDVVKDEQQLAGIVATDGVIRPGDDPIYSQMFSDVVRVGSSRIISEKFVRQLRDPGLLNITTGVGAEIRANAERKVTEGVLRANQDVDATVEYLGMRALMGYIPWPPPQWANPPGPQYSNAKFAIDYGFKFGNLDADAGISFGGSTLGAGYYWTDLTNSDPIKDCMAIMTKLTEESGVPVDQYDIIMSGMWKYYLIQNATLRDLLKQSANAPGLLNWAALQSFWESMAGFTLTWYDGQYTKRALSSATDPSSVYVTRHRILPSNYVLFVPKARGYVGDFPTSPSKPNDWRTGKFTWREEKVNPWTTEVGVGINCFPRIRIPDAVAVLKIAQDPIEPPNINYS